jgi:hypothetical protein
MLVADILARISKQLYDEIQADWIVEELLRHLNAGIRLVVKLKPESFVVPGKFKCVEGTRQVIPADAVGVCGVNRNLGADGLTPGRVVTETTVAAMDGARPDWHSSNESYVARHWMRVENDPYSFLIWPPMDFPGSYLDVSLYAIPDPVTADSIFPLKDLYEQPIVDFVLSQAYIRRSAEGDLTRYQLHLSAIAVGLGLPAARVRAAVQDQQQQVASNG